MNLKTTLFLCLFASATLFASMVPNSNFESGENKLDSWSFRDRGKKNEAIPASSDGIKGKDTRAAWIDDDDNGKALLMEGFGDDAYCLIASDPIPIVAGCKYKLKFKYKAEGLMRESGDRSKYAAAIMDFFITKPGKGLVDSCRMITYDNSKGWSERSRNNRHRDYFVAPDLEGCSGQVRLQLVNKYPGNKVKIQWDDIILEPVDMDLRNAGFEDGEDNPVFWKPLGAAQCEWVKTPVKTGARAIRVSDAPDGLFSGWTTEIPVRLDRKYVFGGFVKGGDLNPNGFIGGGALQIRFFDKFDTQVGEPVTSPAIGANTDWTKVETLPAQPPRGAVKARLTAGLNYCNGSAWFDDLFLETSQAKLENSTLIKRQTPAPCENVTYSENLLKNGDMEKGEGDKPANWKYVGKSVKDWTKEEIKKFHDDGRPNFHIGRGKGTWSDSEKYAGGKALLNVSIDPPLSPNHQWYGRNHVDGYWLSDSMPCQAGEAYIAGGWINPGAKIAGAWYGPLLLSFYDDKGRELDAEYPVRSSMSDIKPSAWTWWATQPFVAPKKAITMRLKFIQELKADNGGWGRTFADNLAVWKVPAGAKVKDLMGLNNRFYHEWFINAHRLVKPPYLPSPTQMSEYCSIWGNVQNVIVGNLFEDPDAPAVIRFNVFNLLGEKRNLKLFIERTDWLGENAKTVESAFFELDGFSEKAIELELPPTGDYGAFHLDVTVKEGEAKVGEFSGRYGVMPPLNRARTTENIWAITPLTNLKIDGSKYEMELGELLKIAGFGKSWIRLYFNCSPYDVKAVEEIVTQAKRVCCWYRALGITPILQINPPKLPQKYPREVDKSLYFKLGEIIGKEFDGLVAAVGNWGIEQANSKSPYRGGGKLRVTDQEYDTILGCIYDGVKSVAPDLPVMIGNIATDFNADTIERLYKAPANGRFQGAFFNAYMGQLMVGANMIKAFDRHGNKDYTIWSEEQANQRSPFEGSARRYSEADGPKNMIRTWLAMAAKLYPRIKAITIWGFSPNTAQDIMMMTPDLQPRPQFVAHAVMADALADAEFKADLSSNGVTLFKWKRAGSSFFVTWANSGKRSFTIEVSEPFVNVMDLMGNIKRLKANQGLVTLDVTSMPFYFFSTGTIELSKRIEVKIENATTKAGEPKLVVNIRNNSDKSVSGELNLDGIGSNVSEAITISAHDNNALTFPITTKLPDSKRSSFRAEVKLDSGAVFATVAEMNFAQAVKVDSPPALDGTWNGWEASPIIEFGKPGQIRRNSDVGEQYDGANDLFGKIRFLWDDQNLYLGVESKDNKFVPNPQRGKSGFMGDSIEFGVQPDHILNESAPKYEFELYLPADGRYAASQRFPLPGGIIDHWSAKVAATGKNGDAVYQVAIPWKDLGVESPKPGRMIAMSVVLNDKDNPDAKFSGKRDLIHWFGGVHSSKNPEKYGDVTLVLKNEEKNK